MSAGPGRAGAWNVAPVPIERGCLGNQPQQRGAVEALTNWLVSADKLPRPLTSYIMVI